MAEPSSEKLALALEEQNFWPLAARARRDEFHDFQSPHALPEIELVKELQKLGKRGRRFAQRIKDGEFDATREESDRWARSEDGQATMRSLTNLGARRRGHP